jgi:streptogramin lyase
MSRSGYPSPAISSIPQIKGGVHGGQQPVSGAAIQLYASSITALAGASTPLLTTTVTSDVNGSFTITGDYTCPSSNSLVYIVATGGNPGLPGPVTNSGIALMAAIGPCGNLTSSTFIQINELTTVAAVEALAPFMSSYTSIGAPASNSAGLAGAFSTIASLVDFTTGQAATPPSGVTPPSSLLNTVADILAACVNTDGSDASTDPCGILYQSTSTTSSSNTIAALLAIVQHPAQNVAALFSLATAAAPFQPSLATVPANFMAAIIIPLPALQPQGTTVNYPIAVDTAQHVWIYNGQPEVDGSFATGPITVYDTTGSLLYTVAAGAGGLNASKQLAADPFGNVWALNTNATLAKFGPDGTALSPSSGFAFPTAAGGSTGYPNLQGSIGTLAIDPSGNVWTWAISGCYLEFKNDGTLLSFPYATSGAACTVVNLPTAGNAFSVDGTGNIYIGSGYNPGILKFSNTGSLLSPATGFNDGGIPAYVLLTVYDRAQQQVWATVMSRALHLLKSNGTAVSPSAGFPLPHCVPLLEEAAVDGSGNLWFTDAFGGSLNEFDPSGNTLTPDSSSTCGYAISGTGTTYQLAIDASGNIWTTDYTNHYLIKVPGLASPKTYQ